MISIIIINIKKIEILFDKYDIFSNKLIAYYKFFGKDKIEIIE